MRFDEALKDVARRRDSSQDFEEILGAPGWAAFADGASVAGAKVVWTAAPPAIAGGECPI